MAVPKLAPETVADLERSGLTKETITSADIRDGTTDEEVATLLREKYHVKGYLIDYRGLNREQLKFYRVKVLSSLNGASPPKYLQPKAAGNHLYTPPGLHDLYPGWIEDTSIPVFITEGEKKALAGVQAGLAVLAVGGVYSWRTHIHTIERGVVRVEDKPSARIVHLDDRGEKAYRTQVAPELADIQWEGRSVYLIFDSDAETNEEVQRAAFELANWLEDHGADTRQISLAARNAGVDGSDQKVGLDDLLLADPTFGEHLGDVEWLDREGFRPLPSDPLGWTTEQLNAGRTTRETQERVARFAINWLDANGTRFMGIDGTYYYFDNETRVLHDFEGGTNLASIRETSFGHLLMEQLGIDPVDGSTLGRMIGRFPLGASIIHPHRVLAQSSERPDALYYQVSDSDVVRISAKGLDIISNGDDDVLFYKGTVEATDLDALAIAADEWKLPRKPLWYEALSTLNIDPMGDLDHEGTIKLLSTLFYLSPWLNRWRGLMVPLEIAVGEPGSGKTFTYNLRKGVLTGRTSLSGLPDDFRSWVAAVGAAPSIWICDNLGNVKSDYWHRLNDELARLITDPAPTIELRQLYTTATTMRVPVGSAFAITTIRNPFTAPDVLQRSLLYGLSAIPVGKRDPDWYADRMDNRIGWVAEHLNVLHLFFKEAAKSWKANYKSGYRLVHFEQACLLMGRVLGWDLTKVVAGLAGVVAATVAQYDPVIEALAMFVEEWPRPRRRVNLRDVIDWAQADSGDRFINLRQFANEIILGKYVAAHKYDIEQSIGIKIEKEGNANVIILPGPEPTVRPQRRTRNG